MEAEDLLSPIIGILLMGSALFLSSITILCSLIWAHRRIDRIEKHLGLPSITTESKK